MLLKWISAFMVTIPTAIKLLKLSYAKLPTITVNAI